MTTDVEGFTALGYTSIDPTTRGRAPFLATRTWLEYAATARCGELAELVRIDSLKGIARNERCISESKSMSGDNE
jgi:hypothetical protein